MSEPVILVTNDDGVDAVGLGVLARAARALGRVLVVAPVSERSGCGQAITVPRAGRPEPLGVRGRTGWYRLDGTPSDCVDAGLEMSDEIAIVLSGVNAGANVGVDVHYSGTVAAAKQAVFRGVPGVAVSTASRRPEHPETAAAVAVAFARLLLTRPPTPVALNVNAPDVPLSQLRGVAVVRQALGVVARAYDCEDAHKLLRGAPDAVPTDAEALMAGAAAVMPISLDATAAGVIDILETWRERAWTREPDTI